MPSVREPAGAGAPLLKIEGLRLSLGGCEILAGVDLTVHRGEIHALLGANGAGKSSLAYAIVGCEEYRPAAGEMFLAGERMNELPMHERARRGITLAWQEPARLEGLTARGYVGLGCGPGQAARYLEAVGLEPERYLDRFVDKTLSGGERKRIELAAVAAMRPKLAILDEPAAGIDFLSVDEIVGVIETLHSEAASVLLITHEKSVVRRAQRASLLCGGRVALTGPVSEVVAAYEGRGCLSCGGRRCNHA